MKKPPFLRKGDIIGVTSTARKISPGEMEYAIDEIRSWGMQVQLSSSLYKSHNQFAGNDRERTDGLQELLDDENVRAIICARGGYGTVRILDSLDYTAFEKNPKWIAGYSDVTALHAYLNNVIGYQSIHSTMPINFKSNTGESMDSLKKALFGGLMSYEFQGKGDTCNLQGTLIGGNLSMIYSIQGCPEMWTPENKILFIEDLDEYLYHVDRMMMNLKRSGFLGRCRAILIGGLTDMNDNNTPFGKTAEEIVLDVCSNIDIPLIMGFPAGHGKDNRAFYCGAEIALQGDGEYYSLDFLQ